MNAHSPAEFCRCTRAPVQADRWHRAGTVGWCEHSAAWTAYNAKYRGDQSAERIAERGGFSFLEIESLLGHEPLTFEEDGVRRPSRDALELRPPVGVRDVSVARPPCTPTPRPGGLPGGRSSR